MTTEQEPEIAIVNADELHPLDGMDPDGYEYEILAGILEDEGADRPEPWYDALVGVVEPGESEPSRWLVYWGDCYVGTRRTKDAARALWDHLRAGGAL